MGITQRLNFPLEVYANDTQFPMAHLTDTAVKLGDDHGL
jgi:hypothetical protein